MLPKKDFIKALLGLFMEQSVTLFIMFSSGYLHSEVPQPAPNHLLEPGVVFPPVGFAQHSAWTHTDLRTLQQWHTGHLPFLISSFFLHCLFILLPLGGRGVLLNRGHVDVVCNFVISN